MSITITNPFMHWRMWFIKLRNLDALASLKRCELVARWRTTFDALPPKHLSAPFMIKAIGFEMQCKTFGYSSKSTERRLKTIARGGVAKTP